PPLAGEGWGGGQWVASEPTPIPAFPRKRGKGRPAVSPRPARDTRSLPRKRGRVGVGAVGRIGPGPIPAFPRKRGEGRTVGTPRPARAPRPLPRWRGRVGVGGSRPHRTRPPSRPSPARGAGRTVVTPRPVRDTRVHGIRHINQIISDRF